jgi:hypothetical protein
MRGAEADAGGGVESGSVFRQRSIRVSQPQHPHLLVASRIEFRRTPGARLLGQRLAATVSRQPAMDRPSMDTKQTCRFTWGQPGIKGRHQALSEVG